ncbi:MAG: hypothetical protein IT210_23615 [Armatimonadetes bacterium]|nr:hypothetical protein [Armatimonadota bacterium]
MAQRQCLQTKNLHDISAAVDALQGLPFTDRDRIGIISHSMGGEQAYFSA